MNADADACDLAAIYQLEAAAVVQHADHIFAMTSSLSCGDLVAIVNLNDAAARQLDCERLEGRLRLHMSNFVNHGVSGAVGELSRKSARKFGRTGR
jgi:hypothetical protein